MAAASLLLLTLPAGALEQASRQLPAATSGRERRIALVVGNDRYAGPMALQNARRDATAIATELRAIGFQTTLVEDATRARLIQALDTLSTSIASDDVVLFYYAGHGAQVGGENYLVPVDYSGTTEQRLMLDGVSAGQIQTWLKRARVSILVLDACRNNPYSGQRSTSGGLAPMEARGSLVAFATGAGQTASDNPGGGQGTFTGALLDVLREPGLSIREVFFRVRQRVYEISRGQQFPAVYDGLLGDVVLRPATGTAPAPPPVTAGRAGGPPGRPGAPPAPVREPAASGASPAPSWLVGDFRGVNALTNAYIELTIQGDGTIVGMAGAGTARQTPVRYEWVGASQQMRDPTGAYAFEVERTDLGFRTRQIGSPTNTIEYRRVYLPPGSTAADARGGRDVPRQPTPDEQAAMMAVVNEWKAAWEAADETAGRAYFPTWSADALRKERLQNNVEKATATLTCNSISVRRDQARLNCRASVKTDFKRQGFSLGRSAVPIGQRAPSQTRVAAWAFVLFWNGSTWLIESLS